MVCYIITMKEYKAGKKNIFDKNRPHQYEYFLPSLINHLANISFYFPGITNITKNFIISGSQKR